MTARVTAALLTAYATSLRDTLDTGALDGASHSVTIARFDAGVVVRVEWHPSGDIHRLEVIMHLAHYEDMEAALTDIPADTWRFNHNARNGVPPIYAYLHKPNEAHQWIADQAEEDASILMACIMLQTLGTIQN